MVCWSHLAHPGAVGQAVQGHVDGPGRQPALVQLQQPLIALLIAQRSFRPGSGMHICMKTTLLCITALRSVPWQAEYGLHLLRKILMLCLVNLEFCH